MSRALSTSDYDNDCDFEMNARVSFLHEGERLEGEVVRIYNTRLFYHVLVDGRRYEVDVSTDDMRRA